MALQRSDVHIDTALTTLAGGYRPSQLELVWDFLMPMKLVKKDSDKFFVFGREVFRTGQESSIWNDGTDYNTASYTVTQETYSCIQHALADYVTDEQLRNSDVPLDPFNDATEFLTDRLLLDLEKEVATKCTTAGNYPAALTATPDVLWDTFATSDPINDIIVGCNAIRAQIGVWPTRMVVGASAWIKLAQHPDIVELVKYNKTGLPDTSVVASTYFNQFGLREIKVAGAINITSVEGETEVVADVWGKHVVLAYVDPADGLKRPSFGRTFVSGGELGVGVEVEREPRVKRAQVVNVVKRWNPQFIMQDSSNGTIAGYFLNGVVS